MNFIKKIKDKNFDELVHLQFQKFSKGIFKDRAILKVKKSKEKYTINTSAEFANEFVLMMAKKLGTKRAIVTGAIVSTSDLKGKLEFKDKKQFQGVKRYIIEKEMSGEELLSLLEEIPKAFFGLSFNVDESNKLKIKGKAPKSGKPGKEDKEPKANFCKLITNDRLIGKSFVFEKENFKEANIKHNFIINEIIFPQGEKDFAKIRELAKRKGIVERILNIDGDKSVEEFEFTA